MKANSLVTRMGIWRYNVYGIAESLYHFVIASRDKNTCQGIGKWRLWMRWGKIDRRIDI